MRQNLPVTQREHPLPAGATLMSTTDTRSHITYANAAFVEASGFERDELRGQPHNLVRHPDMPAEAFADMWSTLKSGNAWTALVKNRRKDGGHYWVRANATPVHRDGALVGYMSVRTVPERQEVEFAERFYAALREGAAAGRALRMGLVVRTGWARWRSALQLMPTAWRLWLGATVGVAAGLLAAVVGLPAAAAWAVGGVGALAGGWWLSRQFAQPLAFILRQAQSVASGLAPENRTLDRADDVGLILRAVNQAGLNTRSLVDDVAAQVNGLRDGSREIAAGVADLSARTETAASNLQQTAAAVEQTGSSLQHSAESAAHAQRLAHEARSVAQQGGDAMARMVSTMGGIESSSRRIGEIIAVIDDLAFQTNVLALNAAVEAARAGEQGRGFAVVAAEVRALAGRSATAAQEIKALIGESMASVERGTGAAAEASQTMTAIVQGVDGVNALIGEIASATVEQSRAMAEVTAAVGQLDQLTQMNATLVEQKAAAAQALSERVDQLVEAITVFKRMER